MRIIEGEILTGDDIVKFSGKKMLAKGGVAGVTVTTIVVSVLKLLDIEGIDEATVSGIIGGVVTVVACLKNWIKNR